MVSAKEFPWSPGSNSNRTANEEGLLALAAAIDLNEGRSSRRDSGPSDDGVEGNARLTASIAAVIFVLLAVEGLTIVRIGNLLDVHVFIGVLLIAPVLVKVATTSWRFAKYYSGERQYRLKGPPALVLRLLGPLVVVLTLVVLFSGVGLVLLPASFRQQLFFVHRASFILWLGVMTIHVLGHLGETIRLAPRDWLLRTRRQVAGATSRQWVLVSSMAVGLVTALALTPYAYGWFGQF